MIEFASILEQSAPENRKQIIAQVREQDPEFILLALRKTVFFEELHYLDESVLAEILSKTSPKLLAYALADVTVEFKEILLRQLGLKEHRELREEEEKLPSPKPANRLIWGAKVQILETARKLEREGKFVFELDSCPRFKPKKRRRA